MTKHILLEGPMGCGKTTTILRLLQKFHIKAGGFVCCKVVDEKNETKAFFIASPQGLGECNVMSEGIKETTFLSSVDTQGVVNNQAFLNAHELTLKDTSQEKVLVLDEIGGVELMLRPFRERLTEILQGDVPVIGVLKSSANSKTLTKNARLTDEYSIQYAQFRQNILDNKHVTLVYMDIDNRDEIARYLESWAKKWGLIKDE